jgi:peptide deformylase
MRSNKRFCLSLIGLAATQVNQHLQVVVMDVLDSGEDYQLILENRTTKNWEF